MEGKQELFKFFSIVEFLSLDLTMLFYGIIQLYYFVRVYILNPIRNMYCQPLLFDTSGRRSAHYLLTRIKSINR